jgi:integral membrane sensor domain MASE1
VSDASSPTVGGARSQVRFNSGDRLPSRERPRPTALDRLRIQQIPGPVLLLVVAAGYIALAQFVLWLNDPVNLGAGFWPAAGLSLALLVLLPPSRWGWVLAGVAVAELGGDLAHGYPLDASLWWTAGNCVEPLVGAMLLRRWGNPAGALVPLHQLRRFFGAAVVVGPLVGASIGSIGTVFAMGNMGMWQIWPKYFVGDALGVLVVAPLLLCWQEQRIARRLGETMTLAVALLAVTVVSFRT